MLDERDIEILQEMFDRSYTRFEDSIIAELRSVRETLEDHGLSKADYALCGGGFPARLKDGTLVGAVTVSNLYHIADHEFVTASLREYLNCPDCPEYPYTVSE